MGGRTRIRLDIQKIKIKKNDHVGTPAVVPTSSLPLLKRLGAALDLHAEQREHAGGQQQQTGADARDHVGLRSAGRGDDGCGNRHDG